MPRPSEYTPARRRILQAVMAAILVFTIGLAALVGAANRRANRVELSPNAVAAGDIAVRLPAKWRSQPRGSDDPAIVAQAEENPAAREFPRKLSVMFERLDAPVSPLQYLIERFRLPVETLEEDEAEIVQISAATVAGQPGVVVTIDALLLGGGMERLPQKDVYAAAVLPSRRAVVVHVRGFGRPDLTDRLLAQQVAAAITVNHEPPVDGTASGAANAGGARGAGGAAEADAVTQPAQVTLPAGTRFMPPLGLAAVAESDPLRRERLLWPVIAKDASVRQVEGRWATAEVVECLIPPAAAKDSAAAHEAFSTLLLVRDPAWRSAAIRADGANRWRAELAHAAAMQDGVSGVSARAHLLVGSGGRGVLVVFRGGFGGGFDFDAAWSELAESVTFGAPAALAALETGGASVASRLKRAGYEALVSDRTEQWWLWTDNSDRPHRAWSHLDFDAAGGRSGALRATTEARRRHDGRRISRLSGAFRYADADAAYQSEVTRTETVGGESARSLKQVTALRNGQVSLNLASPSRPIAQWKAPAPPQFVPGEILPLIMDRVISSASGAHTAREDTDSAAGATGAEGAEGAEGAGAAGAATKGSDRADGANGAGGAGAEAGAVLLRSESFPGFEAVGAPQLLTILVRPVPNTTRIAEGETEPMRCVEAEVNGSGVASRWYFRQSGAVECVELPGGVQRTPSDAKAVGYDFSSDSLMSPPK